MIKVRVLPPPGWSRKMLDERYWIELKDDAKLSDVLAAIRMPKLLARAMFVSVNGTISGVGTKLEDGDSVSFFPIAHGGEKESVVPRVPRKKEKIDEIRDTILDYALDIIVDEGYDNLTMRELGDRLGCAAKTIYNYYSCKEEIYLRILVKGFELLNNNADAALNGVTDPVEKLRVLCNAYISFGMENVHYYNLMFSRDVPKYTSYLGTYFESAARKEKETAMYYAVVSEAAISEILKKNGRDSEEERAYHLVRMWSMLHGYVSLHNSRSFPEYYSDTLQFQQRIVDELLAGLQ